MKNTPLDKRYKPSKKEDKWYQHWMGKKYFRADVVNHSDYLEVFSHEVLNPAYIRYAWSDTSVASLFNSEGLPASSFKFENE